MPNTVIRAIGEILLLRGGPQNLPTSYPLLAAVSFLLIVSSTALFRLQGMTGLLPVLQALASFAILVIYLRTLLRLRKHDNRLPQTLTALVIVGCAFSVLAYWPISILMPYMEQVREGAETQAPVGPTLLVLMLGAWSLAVQAHVLRVALEVRLLTAFMLVLLYEVLSVVIMNLLFGHAMEPAARAAGA
jgi:hypothetical protein